MNKEIKLKELENAYKLQKRGEGYISVINTESSIHDAIRDIQFNLNQETGTFELDYEIMDDACNIINDNIKNIDELKKADFYELAQDVASVYTATRLSYLNNQNEAEISDIVKEYECDIQTACAIWYERQVTRACELIREWIMED
jgi:hypothetical protein